jgi:hypothetical protein
MLKSFVFFKVESISEEELKAAKQGYQEAVSKGNGK